MATKKLRLTWDDGAKRWRKMHKGETWTGKRGVKKSDDVAYKQAVAEFEAWRAKVDQQVIAQVPDKLYAEQYERAIAVRQRMIKYCQLEGDTETQEFLENEIAWISKQFTKPEPQPLNFAQDGLPWDAKEGSKWRAALGQLTKHEKWTAPVDKEKTVSAAIKKHLAARLLDAQSKQITPQRYDNIKNWLSVFQDWVRLKGDFSLEQFTSNHLSDFREFLLGKMKKGSGAGWSSAYAHSILNEAKLFCNWLHSKHYIENQLRDLKSIVIRIEKKKPKSIPITDVVSILKSADSELKLYCLLMLNCGFTPKDVSDLLQDEVDWALGRITRKRSKMKQKESESIPTVNYKLWTTTFDLLKKHRSSDKKLVLLNCMGKPLKPRGFKGDDGEKLEHNDTIGKALEKLCAVLKIDVSPKNFRATSANILFNSRRFRVYHQLFLGQSVKTVAETNYVSNEDDT
ncbi:MAG: hypothetical protein ABSG53_01200, partial [Thermoguttaceae bacterium]